MTRFPIRSARAKSAESGYAMLLVFLMAALIAIALYNELPRVAFEKQRDKEQLLVERGEQYKRAIQLFVRKMGRYPATIDELESTNNIRFLRRRYIDPMTGKDTWRLIHINGGVLTDSIIQKNKPGQNQDQQQANTNTFIGEGPAMGGSTDPSQQQNNPALRRRASDNRPVVTSEAPQQPADGEQNGEEGDNSNGLVTDNNAPPDGTQGTVNQPPGVMPNQPGMMPGMPVRPGMMVPGMANQPLGTQYSTGAMPNQQAVYGMPGGTQQTAYPGQNQGSTDGSSSSGVYAAPGLGQSSAPTGNTTMTPGMPGQPGMAYPNQQQGFSSAPTPFGQPASNGAISGGIVGGFNSGFQQTAGQNQQAGGITMNDLGLTSARPGGLQGIPGMSGTQMGGGIAGVASESKSPSIMVYNERKKYNEWEFVYDQTKDRGLAGVQAGGGAPGTSAAQMGNMPQGLNAPGQNGSSPFGNNSPFGASSGPGGNSPFGGSSSFGGGSFGQQPPQPQQPQQQPPN